VLINASTDEQSVLSSKWRGLTVFLLTSALNSSSGLKLSVKSAMSNLSVLMVQSKQSNSFRLLLSIRKNMTGKKQIQCSLQRKYRELVDDCVYYWNECTCWRRCGAWFVDEVEADFALHLKPKYYPTLEELQANWFRVTDHENFKRLVARRWLCYSSNWWVLTYNKTHKITFDTKENFTGFFWNLKNELQKLDSLSIKK